MPAYSSSRGEKPKEIYHRPEGRNTIVTVWASGNEVHTVWGQDYECTNGPMTVDQALRVTIAMGRTPLLWTYSEPDVNYTELKIGFDELIGTQKIGHVALAAEATIAGEIYLSGAKWRINNESGAWGNMGGHSGKSLMLHTVAKFMADHCSMIVSADVAVSRFSVKRAIQRRFR